MCCAHVLAANLARIGPTARCSAYRLSPALSRARESNRPRPCSARNSVHSLTARAQFSYELGAGAPLSGSSRNHRLITVVGRGTAGPSSNSRSDEKKLKITSGHSRNAARRQVSTKRVCRQPFSR